MNELGSNNTYFFYSSYTKKLCIEQLEGSGLKKEWCFRAKLLYAALHTSFWYIQISFSIMLYVVS